ncbi:hypothetical protein SMACR_00886 [Sordaria macrospora]|nr:hypothetical protein SMACR_00886 [Sordaria macrospora]WPJ62128.1 hypothetical protein SMAC4_00886 [Sordaria macrospora]
MFEQRTTLHFGSRLLLLVHVRLLPTAPRCNSKSNRHRRQSSDDLIEDLEYHLGSTKLDYLQVRIRYQHSGFSQRTWVPRNTTMDGIVNLKTSVETKAVAVIKQQGSSSLWSPRDVLQPNPLFEIIASHWGVETTSDVIHRILSSRSLPAQRRAMNHQQSSLPVRLHDTSGTSGAQSISFGPEPTPIQRAQTPFRIPRQSQSALAVRTAMKPTAMLTRTRTMESKSDNNVKPPAPPTRAAPPIPRRQTSLNIRTRNHRLSGGEGGHGDQRQDTVQSYEKAFPFLTGEDSDSPGDDSVQRATAHAASYRGPGADIHAHGSVTRNIRTSYVAAVGRLPSTASISSSETYGGEDYEPQPQEQDQNGRLSNEEERATPTLVRSSHPNQTRSDHSSFTRTPRTGGSTGSIIKRNRGSDINVRDSSDDDGHLESSLSLQQSSKNSLRTRTRPSEQSKSSSFASSSVTATSAKSRQNRGRAITRPPPPPPCPPVPGATTSSEEHLSSPTSMSRTSSMTTRVSSPAEFDAMEFGLVDTPRRADGRGKAPTRSGRATGYDGNHSDDDTQDTGSYGMDLGFTTQTLPSRNNRQSGLQNGSGGFLGIDRVRQVAGNVNGPNGFRGRVAAAAARYETGGGAGGSLNSRTGGVTMGSGTGSWRQKGNQARVMRGDERVERVGESKDREKEKQPGRWAWPSWWL